MRKTTHINLDYIINHADFTLALCSFLDDFKRSSNKYAMIASPPTDNGVIQENLCLLAAISHKLAIDYNIEVPEWVHDATYKMPYPVFSFNTQNKEYQQFLITDAPLEFASKNIFHSSRAIERV